jgi:hypothetical protein
VRLLLGVEMSLIKLLFGGPLYCFFIDERLLSRNRSDLVGCKACKFYLVFKYGVEFSKRSLLSWFLLVHLEAPYPIFEKVSLIQLQERHL